MKQNCKGAVRGVRAHWVGQGHAGAAGGGLVGVAVQFGTLASLGGRGGGGDGQLATRMGSVGRGTAAW